jgi:hypothetical protein
MYVVRFRDAAAYSAGGHLDMAMVRLQEISNGDAAVRLERWDSCRIAPGESGRLENKSEKVTMVLLAMPRTSELRAGAKTKEQST